MQDCNPIGTLFARGENLSKEMGPNTPKEKRKIANAFGSLMYAMMCTRLYIYIYICIYIYIYIYIYIK